MDTKLPDWLSAPETDIPKSSKERKALALAEYEVVLPRVLDAICAGCTLNNAVKELPYEVDVGAFNRWLNKDPVRYEMYVDAKRLRAEVWAGKMIEYADGGDSLEDVNRSKLKVDTLKWLIGSDNRKVYGDSKQIQVEGSISITAALAAAQSRTEKLIQAETVELLENNTKEGEDD